MASESIARARGIIVKYTPIDLLFQLVTSWKFRHHSQSILSFETVKWETAKKTKQIKTPPKKRTQTKLVGKRFQLILFSGGIITIHRPSFIGIVSRGDPMQESAQERFLTREVQPLTRLYAIRDLTIRQRRRPWKRMNHFKLFRDYPNSPCCLKEGDFGWSWREGNALKFGQRW